MATGKEHQVKIRLSDASAYALAQAVGVTRLSMTAVINLLIEKHLTDLPDDQIVPALYRNEKETGK